MTRERLIELLELHDRKNELELRLKKVELMAEFDLSHAYVHSKNGMNIPLESLTNDEYKKMMKREITHIHQELNLITQKFERA
jgi:hypothetical protein